MEFYYICDRKKIQKMKNFLILAIISITVQASAQDYKLFNAGTRKLFTSSLIPDSTYGFVFDSVAEVGNDSVYFPNTGLTDWITSDTCEFWGGNECIKQDLPSWMGSSVIFDNNSCYSFFNNSGDTLQFNFDLSPGDSSLFYEDASQMFYMHYEGRDTTTVLGLKDSVKFFRISHMDADGNPINSTLNNQIITFGKDLGFIDFFMIHHFPDELLPVSLLGNKSPAVGIWAITYEMLYDHQPGDVIQYSDLYSNPGGPPWLNYHRYITHTFLSRDVTPDSIIYQVARFTFEADSITGMADTIFLKYRRNAILVKIPFDHIEREAPLRFKDFYRADFCDINLWAYTNLPGFFIYCPADNCWGPYDLYPVVFETYEYVLGLGIYREIVDCPLGYPAGFFHPYVIIFFKKNGIECGNQVIVNIPETVGAGSVFMIYPNPANDYLIVRSGMVQTGTIYLSDLNGREILSTSIDGPVTRIDTAILKPGMYLVRVISGNFVEVKKIIIE